MNEVMGHKVYLLKKRLSRLSKVNKETGCIEWLSSKRNGYGRLIIGSRSDKTRRSVSAHRLSYELYKGEIPESYYVCHHCDNKGCINPDHLFVGTHQDNVNDREIKGRNNHTLKLTNKEVAYIRNHPRKYNFRKELAERFGVSIHTIKDIRLGKTRPTPPKDKGTE